MSACGQVPHVTRVYFSKGIVHELRNRDVLRHHALLDALMHCVLGALDTLCMGGLEPTCRNVPLNTVSQKPSQKKSTGCFGPKQGFAKLPSWTFTSRCSCILPCVAGRSHGRGASCASQGGTQGFMRDCTNSGSQRPIFFACRRNKLGRLHQIPWRGRHMPRWIMFRTKSGMLETEDDQYIPELGQHPDRPLPME